MNRLSSAVQAMKPHYQVLVVGSGYGGAIAASRMARAGCDVCLLERGREFMAGEFPSTPLEGAAQMQYNTEEAHLGSPLALLEVHVNAEVNAVVGCGLGGTSLINANVALKPDERLWRDPRWPASVRNDIDGLRTGYQRAWDMLQPSPVPDDFPRLPKLDALQASAQTLGWAKQFSRPPVTVTFRNGKNAAGVEQARCIGCGDCNSGCNHLAKNSTHMNYLPDAVAHGAQIFTGVAVHSVVRDNDPAKWRVQYQLVGLGRDIYDAPDLSVTADVVIISAGTLGSTALLLRSKEAGLSVSEELGKHFSGNGDVLAFAFNTDKEINGVGWGTHTDGSIPAVGPTICGLIDHRATPDVKDGFVIEEGSLAAPIGGAMLELLGGSDLFEGVKVPHLPGEGALDAQGRILEGLLRGPYHGAMRNTQTYLVMAHDDEAGEIRVQNGRPRIKWPKAGEQPIYRTVENALITATQALGGTYLRNPISTDLFKDRLVTVHPLGGCGMGEDARHGVVDESGRVFTGAADNAVHDGLYVMDGSVMPMSLGVNPLLTISALAERNCARLAKRYEWTIDYRAVDRSAPEPVTKVGLRFTEHMVGDYTPAGAGDAVNMSFTATIISDDLDDMMKNPSHEAQMAGTLTCAALSAQPLTISNGRFNLFVVDENHVDRRDMNYRMTLQSAEGKPYYLFGQKIITHTSPSELWKQTNTLYAEIRDSEAGDAAPIGRATLIITPENFLKQSTTYDITNAPDMETRLAWATKFGKFFGGVLLTEYGGVFAPLDYVDPYAPPRVKRPLRAPLPQVSFFDTEDGKRLRLTRYQGGDRGPVLLIHGSGVSSRMFATDMIGTNLVEYLCALDYDVWLVDLRTSIELPSAAEPTNGDLVAKYDIPAAVAKVIELSGQASIQVVAHCFGAVALTMSLLSRQDRLKGVRSVVLSQVSAHLDPPLLGEIKAGLHVPQLLEHLGIKDMTAFTQHANWPKNLLDEALRVYPVEHDEECDNAICHRATFMYGLLYEHAQLDELLHQNLQELLGVHDVALFSHLAAIVRAGHLVNAEGEDVYMNDLDGLNRPIAFIHGAENRVYAPASTEKTYNMLVGAFGPDNYERHVIDGYGHLDCMFGKNAAADVYPYIARQLNAYARPGSGPGASAAAGETMRGAACGPRSVLLRMLKAVFPD
ncbi:alpha/beta fold hydrolase [Paraburkholderia sp. BL10I2N1]|uniref:alpha/beta fold hydrolase n=1 Tax=Paraburkholderia sp. BL10I2N1 TaxID=1938796 RepID=UPI0010617EDF|nr:alpha/beta fold hydrolase [Paraburkholderia sp. BL10I2N1]TDN63508.1 cholesterol oxidase [Paraburkholderia sp. BL10I2N1]